MLVDLIGTKPPHKGGHLVKVDEYITTSNKNKYTIAERIAAGGNGVVHKCIKQSDGAEFAIKFQLNRSKKSVQRFQLEQELHRELRHNHLIGYQEHGVITGKITKFLRDKKTEDCDVHFIIMDIADCSLTNVIGKKKNKFSFEEYSAQFRGLANGLAELHKKAIHRDIKPSNILVVGEKWVLSDYGLCNIVDSEDDLTRHGEVVGPRFWMSPEANNRSIGIDDTIIKSSDVFQLASVFWLIVNRRHPTGVVTKDDWKGPEKLFDPIYLALHNEPSRRPVDGKAFAEALDAVILQ